MSMKPCNMEITVTIKDLDSKEKEDVVIINKLRISKLSHAATRNLTPKFHSGDFIPYDHVSGPINFRLECVERLEGESDVCT